MLHTRSSTEFDLSDSGRGLERLRWRQHNVVNPHGFRSAFIAIIHNQEALIIRCLTWLESQGRVTMTSEP